MRNLEVWQSTVAQNLAAGQQPGYKSLQIAIEKPPADASGKQVPMIAQSIRDFSPATAQRTGRDLDFAFSDDGFIAAKDANERTILVRNGALQVNASGDLTTAGGHIVEGLDGPIEVVPEQADPRIDENGEVWQGQLSIGKVRTVTVADTSVLEFDGVGWRLPSDQIVELIPVDKPDLRPGYLEEGNLSPLRSMVTLMQITRAFEANQKALQTTDEMIDRTLRSIQ